MVQYDWKSADDRDARFGGTAKLVGAPVADEGVRNALRGAFTCSKDLPVDFDNLLGKLR